VLKPQANGALGLLVQFAAGGSYTPQVQRAIAYMNGAMVANSAPAALFSALRALQNANAALVASYRLAPGASLFVNVGGGMGAASRRASASGGVRFSL